MHYTAAYKAHDLGVWVAMVPDPTAPTVSSTRSTALRLTSDAGPEPSPTWSEESKSREDSSVSIQLRASSILPASRRVTLPRLTWATLMR